MQHEFPLTCSIQQRTRVMHPVVRRGCGRKKPVRPDENVAHADSGVSRVRRPDVSGQECGNYMLTDRVRCITGNRGG